MEYQKEIRAYFSLHREELVRDVIRLVEIPSVKGDPAPGAPYGTGPKQALLTAMELARSAGFTVKNYDNRVCTADFFDAPRRLEILAHLDVVPVEDNWTVCSPFTPALVDGKLYGRGTQDDKGPAIAALYAMKCVRALGVPLTGNVRLVLGTDEECGSSDIDYYYTQEPEAPMTISPDADFPLINLEKGQMRCDLAAQFEKTERLPRVTAVQVGTKSNVVPAGGSAIVVGMTVAEAEEFCRTAAVMTGAQFTVSEEAAGLRIRVTGVGAHAASPEHGNNALTALLTLLAALPLALCGSTDAVRALHRLFPHGDWAGRGTGIAQADEISGALTLCLNMLTLNEQQMLAVTDARLPVCATEENCHAVFRANCEAVGFQVLDRDLVPVHYVPETEPFVQTLLQTYTAWTGQPGKCIAIGGGTYVHGLKNGVAFGCEMPGTDYHIHDADEFMPVDELILAAEMMAQAILELCR